MIKHLFGLLALLCLYIKGVGAQPAVTPPQVTVSAPVSRAPLPDEIGAPLQNGTLRGSLIYASDQAVGDGKAGHGFLAFYSNVASGEAMGKVVIYPLHIPSEEVPFDPQFSPDGTTVLFKVGEIDGDYHLYCLDLKTGTVRLAVKRTLSLRRVTFSPDGEYLAYVAGQPDDAAKPLVLLCNEWKKDREKLIVRNNGTFNGFAWSAPHTLYFTALPNAAKAHPSSDQKGEVAVLSGVTNQKVPTVARPNIYMAAPETGEVQMVMMEGNRPQPSPDGKWIAFFGMETPTNSWPLKPDWQLRPSYVALSIMRAEGLGRMALNVESKTYSQLFWMSDNRRMVSASIIPVTPPSRRREVSEPILKSSLEVRTWDTEDGRITRNGKFLATDLGATPNADGDFPVQALGLTRDGQSLLVVAQSAPQEWHFTPESSLPSGPTVLSMLTLASSRRQTLATLPHCNGVDCWQPTSNG